MTIDQPPEYKSVVLRKEPPTFLESMINEQINPSINHNWAKDLEAKSVSEEVDAAISRSREASIGSLDPNLLVAPTGTVAAQGNFLPIPEGRSAAGHFLHHHHRRATMAHIHLDRNLSQPRTRTLSMSPPVGAIWIGV